MSGASLHILIAGGGIGGLTAALCALHFGHKVTVIERARALSEVGAGLQLSPNAMKVMARLGLTDRLRAGGFTPQGVELRMGKSGHALFHAPWGEATEQRWGAPYLHIHRADLVTALAEALQSRAPKSVRLGQSVKVFSQTESGVSVTLESGETLSGDILIGADGLHSAIRAQMLGPDKPRFTGNMAWRAVVPTDTLGDHAPRPVATAWMGEGRHAVTYLLRGGALANFVGVVETDEQSTEQWDASGDKAKARRDFAGWHPTITTLIDKAEHIYKWPLYDRAPLPRWADGRVALLGDSAHPMLPFMAQGAAMAIEDSWAVMASLSEAIAPQIALKHYEASRLPRTSRVQAASRANAKTFHQRTAFGKLITYGPMWAAGRIAPGIVNARQDWLYGYDVTALK